MPSRPSTSRGRRSPRPFGTRIGRLRRRRRGDRKGSEGGRHGGRAADIEKIGARRHWRMAYLAFVTTGRLTRQELGWLLAQEARGAAKILRQDVTLLSQPPPPDATAPVVP